MNSGQYFVLTLCFMTILSCTSRKTALPYANSEAIQGYVLPPQRPGDLAQFQLEERVKEEPENVVYQRELGALYQSKTTIVSEEQKLPLIKLANKHLEIAFELDPDHPETLMYLGLARASKGTDPELSLFAKVRTALDGFRLMDAAVEKLPQNFCMRMLRAKAGSMVPPILGRGKTLAEDLAFIREYAEQEDKLPPYLRVLGLITLGDAAYKKDQAAAREYWKQAFSLGTHFAQEANWRLKGEIPGYNL